MSYYSWVSDHHNMYVEMKSEREWTGRNYKYKYYIKAYSYVSSPDYHNNTHYMLPFPSKQEMSDYFRQFSHKFSKARNDRYDYETKKYHYDSVSVPQLVEITEETIREMKYSKRRTSKLFQSLFENI